MSGPDDMLDLLKQHDTISIAVGILMHRGGGIDIDQALESLRLEASVGEISLHEAADAVIRSSRRT